MTERHTDKEADQGTFVLDVYKIKVSGRAGELGETPPENWKEVFVQVNRHLMRLVAGTSRLTAEVVEGATRLVRGITGLPAAIASRIRSAHDRADHEENLRQAATLASRTQPLQVVSATLSVDEGESSESALQALDRIELILEKYRAKGFSAEVVVGPDGIPIVVCGMPRDYEAIKEILDRQWGRSSS